MASRIRYIVLVVCLVILGSILLSACNLPSTVPVLEVRYPYCMSTADLQRPLSPSPVRGIMQDLRPVFSWAYPGECRPQNFRIQVIRASHCVTYGAPSPDTESYPRDDEWADESRRIIDEEIGSNTEWIPETPLEPLSEYQWRVAPVILGEVGDFSYPGCFLTGPVCELASLTAPILRDPENDTVIDSDYVYLYWELPTDCSVYSYQAELSDDPSFLTTNFMPRSEFDIYDREVSLPGGFQRSNTPLEDCTDYYWRVRSNVSPHTDEFSWSPYSEVRTFSTDFDGTCSGEKSRDPLELVTETPEVSAPPTYTPSPPTSTPTSIPTWTPVPPDTSGPPAPNPISPKNDAIVDCDATTNLTWSPVSDPSGIKEYRVQLGLSNGQGGWSPAPGSPFVMTPKGSLSMNVPVDCGAFYRWRVRGVDNEDNFGLLSEWAYFSVILP